VVGSVTVRPPAGTILGDNLRPIKVRQPAAPHNAGMRSSRQLGRRLSFALVALLLFSQLVTAAYACPALGLEHTSQHAVAMGDCHGAMDVEQPNLCKSHQDAYAHASSKAISVDLPFIVGAALPVLATPAVPAHAYVPPALQRVRPPGEPPLYLVLSNFRN